MTNEQFCLRWNDHQNVLLNNVDRLLEQDHFVDCTLAAEGQFVGAHKLVLSACSPYFEALLRHHREKHPIFILKDIKFDEVKAIMAYMYRGEVVIPYDKLAELLRAAESLQVKGLGDKNAGKSSEVNGLPQLQQKTPNKPIQSSVTQVRSGGSGEYKRPSAASAEVVDLTDEPQRPRVQKIVGQQRASPYIPRKYTRKLDYQTTRVIQRNSAAGKPNSPGLKVVHSTAQPVVPQNITISAAQPPQKSNYIPAPVQYASQSTTSPPINKQPQMSNYIPAPVQYASQSTSSPPINKQPIVQHVTSLAPGYQKVTSPSHNMMRFTSAPAGATPVQKTQNVQVVRVTPPAGVIQVQPQSSPLQPTTGEVDSPQVQQSQVHPTRMQNIPLPVQQLESQQSQMQIIQVSQSQGPQSQVQPSPIPKIQGPQSQVQPSQIPNIQVQQPQAQQTPLQNVQGRPPKELSPLQTESPQVHSPREETSLSQESIQQDVVMETAEFSTESQNQDLLCRESSMILSTDDSSLNLTSEMDSSNVYFETDENSNDTSHISDDKLASEDTNPREGTSTEPKTTKAKRGRPCRPGIERPFKCPDCGKMFSQKGNMEKHRKTHSGEGFNCDICDKSFVGRSALIRHLRQHENKSEQEKPARDHKSGNKCELCGVMCPTPAALEDHLTVHAGTSSATDQ